MRYIFFIAILFFSFSVFSQEVNQNGYNKFFYPNGQVSSEGLMKNGKPEGFWRTYYVTGVVKSEGKRTNHLLDSIWVFYNQVGDTIEKIDYQIGKKSGFSYKYNYENKNRPDGYIISKELYVNDKREGTAYTYYDNNNIKSTINYVEGKKQGLSFEYSKAGEIITILEYRNNYLTSRERVNRVDKNKLKQGIWKEFYPNGKLHFERMYVDDQLNGYYKEYEENGNLRFAIRYENGKVINDAPNESESIDIRNVFDENGVLISSGPYKDNIPVGIHRAYASDGSVSSAKIYDNSGNVISTGIINDKGEKSGDWKDYYSSGELRDEGKYENNMRTGSWNFYRKDGKVEQTGTFRNDKIHGIWTWYYPSGLILREEEYFIGNEDGSSVQYSELGDIVAEGNYLSGEKDGKWIYRVGDQIEEGNYIGGLKDGIWKYYYLDNTLKFTGNFIQDLPDGKHKYYYNNKALKEDRYYRMGIKHKSWKKYDEEGNVILNIVYKDDLEKSINGVKVELEEKIKRIQGLDGK